MQKRSSGNSASFADTRESLVLSPNQKPEHSSYYQVPEIKENFKESKSAFSRMKSVVVNSEGYFKILDCNCGPDFYNKVLGPTADEAFLKGMRTILDVCKKFMDCDPCNSKEHEVQFEIQAAKPVPKVVSEILESVGLPSELAEQIVQRSFAALAEEKPELASKILQTSTPQMVSQILQTIGLEPDMISQIIQTSFESVHSDKPSLRSAFLQTSGPSLVSALVQTSDIETNESIKSPSKSTRSVDKKTNNSETETIKTKTSESTKSVDQKIESGETKTIKSENSKSENKSEKNSTITQKSNSNKYQSEQLLDKLEKPQELQNKREQMCICCKCYQPPPEIIIEVETPPEIPKMCVCCKCYKNQIAQFRKSTIDVSQSSVDIDSLKMKFESPRPKLCRCYDCATPVLYKRKPYDCFKPRVRCKCYSQKIYRTRTNSGTHLTLAKGDTCSLEDTTCACNKH